MTSILCADSLKENKVKLIIFSYILTLKAPISNAEDYIFYLYFYFNFSKKITLGDSCESSVGQTIHIKCQDIFSLGEKKKKKKKNIEGHLLHFLLGTLRVKKNLLEYIDAF